jgi:hypothetical protein
MKEEKIKCLNCENKEEYYDYGRSEFERGKKVGIKEVISEIEKLLNKKE